MLTRTVVVFGTFDGIHDGHRAFLRDARKLGDRLIILVAHDKVVRQLKKHPPKRTLGERIKALVAEKIADEVVAGDEVLGTYSVAKHYRPEVIALGYDQKNLKGDLESSRKKFDWEFEIRIIPPHKPEEFHSSILGGSR